MIAEEPPLLYKTGVECEDDDNAYSNTAGPVDFRLTRKATVD